MKKKLLVITSTFPRWKNDTLPPFVYELSRRMTDKFDVTILAPAFPGSKDYEVMDKMKVHRFHYFLRSFEKLAGSGGILPTLKNFFLNYFLIPFFLIGEYIALKKLVKKFRPDVIHAHWVIPNGLIAYLISTKCKIPYVVTSHGSDIMGIKGFSYIKKIILENAKHISVVSNALKIEILEKIHPKLNIEVIPMGVDSELFSPKKRDLEIRNKYGIKGPFLLYVGRLAQEKGLDILIKCIPKIIEKLPGAKLVLVGEGIIENELKILVDKLNVTENVVFAGAINNQILPKYYATADVFIGLSRREGLGLTFIEAGMCGCWLVGTKIGGICDVIVNNENGYLVDGNNQDNICHKIIDSIKSKHIVKYKIKTFDKFKWNYVANKYGRFLS